MKRAYIEKIMQKTGLSRTTVRRALDFSNQINSKTALMIRQMAQEMGYRPGDETKRSPFCGIILPEKPLYYWKPIYTNLSNTLAGHDIPYRAVYYSNLLEPELFFSALDSLLTFSPQALVVAAPVHPEARECLQKLAESIPIFLLGERMDAINVFYFGSDNRQDGIDLGNTFRRTYPDRTRLLVLDVAQNSARTEAFLSVCQDVQVVQRIELPLLHPYYCSSFLARRIAAEMTEPFDSVYCSTGILPSICLALDKLKVDPNVICIGYENPPSSAIFWQSGRIGLALCQDIVAQSKACADAVVKLYFDRYFPDHKYNYLDSHILFPPSIASKE